MPREADRSAELAALRSPLLRFAQMQLRNDAMAEDVVSEPLDEQSYDDAIDALFLEDGHWRDRPAEWPTPESALDQRQFMARMLKCVARLPAKFARVFLMRETMARETQDICDDLGITPNYCGVLLYRARMQLRECIEQRWVRGKA